MGETTKNVKEYSFQAEVQKLLHLLASSLYTHKEVFIRELVSNASDALNKMRFEGLTSKDYEDSELALEIRITADKDNKKLIISDTGIGMTEDELKNNLGTIAKSGSLDFIHKMKGEKKEDLDIIGQFGVGFYSAFMVADTITVETKSFQKGSQAFRWISQGAGTFTIEPCEKKTRGTDVILHLKDSELDYTQNFQIEKVIKKYSSFISYPIFVGETTINTTPALWTKSKNEIKEEEYNEFYKFLTNDFVNPMFHLHLSAEGGVQFKSILFIPEKNMEFLGLSMVEHGLSLYSNKIMIQQECEFLMPKYLRFVRGVVDSEDIPLNVSRETIQDDINIRKIKKVLMGKFFTFLEETAEKEKEKYDKFWVEFGRMIKEGFTQDFEYRERLKELLRFHSSLAKNKEELISLKEYVAAMKEGQSEIYYLSGPSLDAIGKSPHLEIFKKKEIPVLFVTDPLDDLVMSHLMEYNGKKVKTADQANLDLLAGDNDKKEDENKEKSETDKSFMNFLAKVKTVLTGKIQDALESKRLTDSPCILVNPDGSMSSHMQKILKAVNKDYQMSPKILEINKNHALVKNLVEILEAKKNELFVDEAIQLLFDSALMLDGYLDNPADTIQRMNRILETSTRYYVEK